MWKVRSVESAECGKCGVWKVRSVESEECGKCGVWKMRSVENEECGKYIKEKDIKIHTCITNFVLLGKSILRCSRSITKKKQFV